MQVDLSSLRTAIQEEYEVVADEPQREFHFHVGRTQADIVGYEEALLAHVPESALSSFAGTGNPFSLGRLQPGENVVDIGSGAGMDSFIAAHMVAPGGKVVGVDMTPAMLKKARRAAAETSVQNVEFRHGYGEELPFANGWADVIISNGVLNLMPDKEAALREMGRVLKPEGRLQIADILVEREVPESAKRQIDLWTG